MTRVERHYRLLHSGYEGVVQMLLRRNDVDANSEDKNSHTPLWWAPEGIHHRRWETLLDDYKNNVNGRKATAKLLTDHLAKGKET